MSLAKVKERKSLLLLLLAVYFLCSLFTKATGEFKIQVKSFVPLSHE